MMPDLDRRREMDRERQRRWRVAHVEERRERDRALYGANPNAKRESVKKTLTGLRADVFGHYGGRCACCGTERDLSIDHIEGNGADHRRELFGKNRGGGKSIYRWLKREGFPSGFQTLCRRCNRSKGTGPECLLHQ